VAGVSEPGFWQELYARGGDGWELGAPAPTLVDVVESTPPPRGRVAVPGCGRGHDVRFLAERGYKAIGFDFAAAPLAAARARTGEPAGARFEQRDVFSLPAEYAGAFDGVWEYTCFCAIDPRRRGEYVRVLEAILRPGGWLLACFYPIRAGGGGPPFPVSTTEVDALLRPLFRIERATTPPRSPDTRRGQEWMVLAHKPEAPGVLGQFDSN
jgi:SAM-dependent methyltransferase